MTLCVFVRSVALSVRLALVSCLCFFLSVIALGRGSQETQENLQRSSVCCIEGENLRNPVVIKISLRVSNRIF